MKKLILSIVFLVFTVTSIAAVTRGPDGRWYGNICITQIGWQMVPWQLVGSMCFAPMFNQYGFIANS